MRVLKTPQKAWKAYNKVLRKKQRYNNTVDEVLFEEAIRNLNTPVLSKGIMIQEPKQITINGISCTLYLLYNPYIIYCKGLAIAMSVTDTVNQVVIFVDDDFMNMTDETKDFIIQHEIGHIVHNHVIQVGVRDIEVEYQADLFASEYGDPIKALTEIKRIIVRRNRKEMDKRIGMFSL